MAGIICLPLVEIGLIDLPKYGGVMASPSPLGTIGLEVSETFAFNVFFKNSQNFSPHCRIENLKTNYLRVTQINYVSKNQLHNTANGCQILNFGLSWLG
jgi:hypothetical protein